MTDVTSPSTYVFDHSWQRERDRMLAIESLLDPSTRRILADRGVRPGWHCLEVGCGAGGVATWLAEQVGRRGRVVAIDLDTRYVDASGHGNLELRRQNVVGGELEQDAFHLAHARAVIEHIPQRGNALERMIASLRPGGWLVIEDVDFGGPMGAGAARYVYPPAYEDVFARIFHAVQIVFEAAGAEASLGPRLPGMLHEAGLVDVGGEMRAPVVQGGSEQWVRGTAEQLSPRLVETGLVSDEEIQAFLAMAADPASHYVPPFMVAAWGRKP